MTLLQFVGTIRLPIYMSPIVIKHFISVATAEDEAAIDDPPTRSPSPDDLPQERHDRGKKRPATDRKGKTVKPSSQGMLLGMMYIYKCMTYDVHLFITML